MREQVRQSHVSRPFTLIHGRPPGPPPTLELLDDRLKNGILARRRLRPRRGADVGSPPRSPGNAAGVVVWALVGMAASPGQAKNGAAAAGGASETVVSRRVRVNAGGARWRRNADCRRRDTPPCPTPAPPSAAENCGDRHVSVATLASTTDGTSAGPPRWAGAQMTAHASGSRPPRPLSCPPAAAGAGGPDSAGGTRTAAATTRARRRGRRRSSASWWASGRCAGGRATAAASPVLGATGTAAAPGWAAPRPVRAHPAIASIRLGSRWGGRPLQRAHRRSIQRGAGR